ncbi:MAG: UbiX family flavin prenyltransferase [Planctomycetota bacterium]
MAESIKQIITAITGASGAIYGLRFLQLVSNINNIKIHLIISPSAKIVFKEELNIFLTDEITSFSGYNVNIENIQLHNYTQINSTIASGSYRVDGMIIIPASMGTIAAISSGISTNLIERSAEVTLKEKRKLIVVPRETPFNTIHLENCLRLSRAGAIILPACPSFYTKPTSVEQLVDTVVFRVIAHLGLSSHFPDSQNFVYKQND